MQDHRRAISPIRIVLLIIHYTTQLFAAVRPGPEHSEVGLDRAASQQGLAISQDPVVSERNSD
jgi:hypothetical protein